MQHDFRVHHHGKKEWILLHCKMWSVLLWDKEGFDSYCPLMPVSVDKILAEIISPSRYFLPLCATCQLKS